MIEDFHFLRPLWLLGILPAVLLSWMLWHRKSGNISWNNAIDSRLLPYLIVGQNHTQSRWFWIMLLCGWLLACIAMAGPSWQKLPKPVYQQQNALVIVLDLSLSMLAEDVKPSRLARARHKILDILQQRREGLTGLIAYSGDAHIVSPLTDDVSTVANLVPALNPRMMPAFGSNPVTAIAIATELLKNSSVNRGQLVLISDAITERDRERINDKLSGSAHRLSVIGVGTGNGAPIPSGDGFLKNNQGEIIVPKLSRQKLQQLAAQNGGLYRDLAIDDSDINALALTESSALEQLAESNSVLTEREFDQWHDRGPWLAMLLLPLALLAFRRGWLLSLVLLVAINEPQTAHAYEWQDLWLNQDQQAAKALEQGNAEQAAELFKNQQWQAAANYRNGNFEAAASGFNQNSAQSFYNRGNALAKQGKLNEAIAAYDQALQLNPEMEDAKFNKQLVEQLKQQQESQQQQSDDSQQNNQSDQSQQDQQSQQSDQSQQSEQDSQQAENSQSDSSQSAQQDDKQSQSEQSQSEQQQTEDQKQAEAEQQTAQQSQSKEGEEEEKQQQAMAETGQQQPLSPEEIQQQQAMEQWLRQIPDDPSGLLRRKFYHQHQQRLQRGEQQQEQPLW